MIKTVGSSFTLCVVCCFMFGCADTATYLKSEPSANFKSGQMMPLPVRLQGLMQLNCTKTEEVYFRDESAKTRCIYMSAEFVDVKSDELARPVEPLQLGGPVENVPPEPSELNLVIDTLLSISDFNCSNFRHRAFANKAGLDSTKNLLQDLATAASAGTAPFSGPVASAFSGVNLLVGKGVDNFNATYFYDKTFQAMDAAIGAERAKARAYIDARRETPGYTLVRALSDIKAYDDACSIKSGLSRLVSLAESERTTSENKKSSVEAEKTDKMAKFNEEYGGKP